MAQNGHFEARWECVHRPASESISGRLGDARHGSKGEGNRTVNKKKIRLLRKERKDECIDKKRKQQDNE